MQHRTLLAALFACGLAPDVAPHVGPPCAKEKAKLWGLPSLFSQASSSAAAHVSRRCSTSCASRSAPLSIPTKARPAATAPRSAAPPPPPPAPPAGARTYNQQQQQPSGPQSEQQHQQQQPAGMSMEAVLLKMQVLQQATSLLEVKVQEESLRIATLLRDPASHDCPVADFALALGSCTAHLGCRVALRRAASSANTGPPSGHSTTSTAGGGCRAGGGGCTGQASYWSNSLRGAFALCMLPGASGRPVGVVADPNFRRQFSSAHMTPRYRAILDAVPEAFVGQATQLMYLTRLLCSELALNFEAQGQVVPPWRGHDACLARWVSSCNHDLMVPLSGPCAGPTGEQALEFLGHAAAVLSIPEHAAQQRQRQQFDSRASRADGSGSGEAGARSGSDGVVVIVGFEIRSSGP